MAQHKARSEIKLEPTLENFDFIPLSVNYFNFSCRAKGA